MRASRVADLPAAAMGLVSDWQFQLVDRCFDTVHTFLQHRLCIEKATIVKIRPNLVGEEFEQELRRKLSNTLIQFLVKIELDLLYQRLSLGGCKFDFLHDAHPST